VQRMCPRYLENGAAADGICSHWTTQFWVLQVVFYLHRSAPNCSSYQHLCSGLDLAPGVKILTRHEHIPIVSHLRAIIIRRHIRHEFLHLRRQVSILMRL